MGLGGLGGMDMGMNLAPVPGSSNASELEGIALNLQHQHDSTVSTHIYSTEALKHIST
jgi:hypothetical protein